MIEVKNLTKYYGTTVGIENLSFQVDKGEVLGFLGPNGAGKTTTMKILTCYLPPTRGTANIFGYDIIENPLEVRKKIGYLPEKNPLYTDMIVKEYLEFVGSLNGGPAVTFRNGDQDVVFVDNGSQISGVARYMTVDFDSVLDITKATNGEPDAGTTLIISTVNKSMNFHVGAFSDQNFRVSMGDLRATNLGFGAGSGRTVSDIDITTVTGVNEGLKIIDEALDQVNRTRSLLGAATNRLESTVANLSVSVENLSASESRLRDADIARESSEFTRNQVMLQAGTSVLAQANFIAQGFLSLLG